MKLKNKRNSNERMININLILNNILNIFLIFNFDYIFIFVNLKY